MARTWVVVMLAAGCGGSAAEPDARVLDGTPLDAPVSFGHGSARPPCEVTIDPTRTPYAMPQVVAGGWSAPAKVASLDTDCPEDAVEISRDGATIYFFASPTVGASPDELLHGTSGTYRAARVGADPGAFGPPTFFDLRKGAVGGASDGELSFTPDGAQVYFHSTRAANTGYQQQPPVDDPLDIYVADVVAGEPGPATNLGPVVNSPYLDGEHTLSPDATRLYLTSTRPGGLGGPDLWVSTWTGTAWGAPTHLDAPVSSTGSELQPAFAADDPETMYFASDRDGVGAIFETAFDGAAWSVPTPVITGYVGEPSLVADGHAMYFVHVLVDDGGVFGADLWYVTR